MRSMLTVLLLTVPVHAFAQGGALQVKRSNPPTLPKPTGFTHLVEVTGAAKTIYVAGQTAADVNGNVVGKGDMKAQSEQVFKNLELALAAAGAKFADVVKINYYVTDMAQAAPLRDLRTKYFGDATPASTLVQIGALARPEYMVEIEVIAVVKPQP